MLEGFRHTKLKSHPKQHRVYWKTIWKSETATPLLRNIWRRSGENSIKYSSPSIRRPWSAPHRGKFFSDSGENKSPISTLPFYPGLISSDNALLTFQIIIFVTFCKCALSCSPFRACPYQIRSAAASKIGFSKRNPSTRLADPATSAFLPPNWIFRRNSQLFLFSAVHKSPFSTFCILNEKTAKT